MPTLRTRAAKTSALSQNELDANFKRTVTQKTTTYQVLISDNRSVIEGNHATTAFTITLPPVATADDAETGDFEVTITNINAAIVTVDGSGAELIDGSANLALQQWASATFALDSAQTGWKVISSRNVLNHVGAMTVTGALTASGGVDGVLGGVTPAAVSGTTGTFTGEVTGTGFTGTLDGILGSGTPAAATVTTITNSDGLLPFPAGTSMLFRQTAAPTGWTKNTSFDNHALKVETGTATSGGTLNFSTFLADTATGSTPISEAEMPSHTHTGPSHTHTMAHTHNIAHTHTTGTVQGVTGGGGQGIRPDGGTNAVTSAASTSDSGAASNGTTSAGGTGATGSAGSGSGHTHSLAQDIKYVDVIIAEKD
jgi:hypothetical protein